MTHNGKYLLWLNVKAVFNLLLLTICGQQGNNTILTHIDTPIRSKLTIVFALLLAIAPTAATSLIATGTQEAQLTPESNVTSGCKNHRNGFKPLGASLIKELQNSNGVVKLP